MPVQKENREELLKIFCDNIPMCNPDYELDRFLSWILSKDLRFETDESGADRSADSKRRLLGTYLHQYIDPPKFRVGRDG